MRPSRARRVEVPPLVTATFAHSTANYASAFALTQEGARARGALGWARAVFEDAPAVLRRCMVFGWAHVLGLRLGPQRSADHVLGWTITDGDLVEGSIALTAESRFLRATNVVTVETSRVTWITLVHYSSGAARPLWALARPIHHLTIPYLLTRAARAGATGTASTEEVA